MKKQDYFVLHKIGCIYLFSQKHLAPEIALDYFIRAGKYASADCLSNSSVGNEQLKGDFNYIDSSSDRKHICLLAADSYDKAALTSYILGNDRRAVHFQELAVENHKEGKTLFNLAKYLFRIGDKNAVDRLNDAIELDPDMLNAIFCDVDIVSSPLIPDFVNRKWAELGNAIEEAIIEQLTIKYSDTPSSYLKRYLPDSAYHYLVKEKKYSEAKRLMAIYDMEKREFERIAKMDSEIRDAIISLCLSCKSKEDSISIREACRPSFLENVKSIEDYEEIYANTLAFIKSYRAN
jgi:tetratricopeptide (TPR) repeat protein